MTEALIGGTDLIVCAKCGWTHLRLMACPPTATTRTTASIEAAYARGYNDAVIHAVSIIERLPKERGWTGARTVGVIGILSAAIRRLSSKPPADTPSPPTGLTDRAEGILG